jgi:hypothetical protein
MRHQWIASEHYRLHTVEGWADSPYKEATLRAIHSSLASLMQDPLVAASMPPCEVCLSRKKVSPVFEFPSRPRADRAA